MFIVAKKCKLIALDTSSSKTGWAIFENAKYKNSGVLNFDTSECKKKYKVNSEQRLEDMCLAIFNLLREHKPDIVVVEKLNVGRNMVAIRHLAKVIGMVYCYSILNGCFYYEIQTSQWRSQIGIQAKNRKRDEYKRLAIKYVKDTLNIDVVEDEADSICAGIGYIKTFT